jgi:hypothetical protein
MAQVLQFPLDGRQFLQMLERQERPIRFGFQQRQKEIFVVWRERLWQFGHQSFLGLEQIIQVDGV